MIRRCLAGPGSPLPTRAARAVAVAAGVGADRLLGEPGSALHPVALFGSAMQRAESLSWSDRRSSGIVYAGAGIGAAALAGHLLAGGRRGIRDALAVALCTYAAVAQRALGEAAHEVASALQEQDLDAARNLTAGLVGRRTENLDRGEVVRAVVESVAENTVDAVTAPILWAAAGGAPGALAYRAANTLDAMVGHRSPRYANFGWASARCDDLLNWVPARLTAASVALVRPGRAPEVWRAVRGQARRHPSPNAGVVEAAFAAALGVSLGGTNEYAGRLERRPQLGWGRRPEPSDIARACSLGRQASAAFLAAVISVTAVGASVRARRRPS